MSEQKNKSSFNNLESSDQMHWGERLARQVIEKFPNEEIYTCAAGISPSGIVHFGNFRDLYTAYIVAKYLEILGKKSRLIFSWDDFDRFRKVPKNVDPSFSKYIGLPYTEVPDPDNKWRSYAERYEKEFEESMNRLDIHPEYIYQSKKYKSGEYDDQIVFALNHRKKIAKTLLSFMPDKTKRAKNIIDHDYIENYYPISLYSKYTGKDNTKILEFDGISKIKYQCMDTLNIEEINLSKEHIVKLSWKVDWPMRWKIENVVFEPGGADHATPGGSFDSSSLIAKYIFKITPPYLQEYKFVGIQGLGSKMSGSKGNVISPNDLLGIYTPEILKWIYTDKHPKRSFELSFGDEIFRQYDTFDKNRIKYNEGSLSHIDKTSLELSGVQKSSYQNIVSFRQILGFGQIVSWNKDKLYELLNSQNTKFNKNEVEKRLLMAKNWLEKYNPENKINLLDEINSSYIKKMEIPQKNNISKLRKYLQENKKASIKEIDLEIYSIPKIQEAKMSELAKLQRVFFKDIYNLLIGKDTGPRLSTFLWALDRQKVINLLKIN